MDEKTNYPKRKPIRLSNYDYSRAGVYFVTMVVQYRAQWLGRIQEERMNLSKIGNIVDNCWKEIPRHFANVELDQYIMMPNHVHGIITIHDVGAAHVRPDSGARIAGRIYASPTDNGDRTKMLLSKIIHGFKSSATRIICRENRAIAFGWQRSFHDRIIRNENELSKIRQYIWDNPRKWGEDEYHSKNT